VKESYLFLFSIFILFISCKKEKDNIYPIINIESPSDLSQFKVLDLVKIKATISDDKIIRTVSIGLYDYDRNEPVCPLKYFKPNSNLFELNTNYSISDSLIDTDRYYLKVTADDGENTESEFVELQISGIRRKSLGPIVATRKSFSTKLYSLENGINKNVLTTFGNDILDIAVNSYHQQLWVIGKNINRIVSYNLKRNKIEFDQSEHVNGLLDPFSDLICYDKKMYIALKTGEIKAYTHYFNDVFTYHSNNSGVYPSKLFFNDVFLLINENGFNPNTFQSLAVFQKSGAVKSAVSTSGKFLGFGTDDSDNPLIFSQSGSELIINRYLTDLSVKQVYLKRFGVIYSDCQALEDNFYLLFGDNGLSIFNPKTGYRNVITSNTTGNYRTVAFDDINNELFIGQGNTLNVYSFPIGNFIRQILFDEPIVAVDIRFNK
jgi:hypothetical protein